MAKGVKLYIDGRPTATHYQIFPHIVKKLTLNFWQDGILPPHLLHKHYPTMSDRCCRCQDGGGTLLHIFWSCPKLTHFWARSEGLLKNSQILRFLRILTSFYYTLPPFWQNYIKILLCATCQTRPNPASPFTGQSNDSPWLSPIGFIESKISTKWKT